MKPIMTSYPGFQELPRGIKKLLLVSETHFFEEQTSAAEPLPAHGSSDTPLELVGARVALQVHGADARPP